MNLPGSPTPGGWSVERLPVWVGAWIAFAVTAGGAIPCMAFALLGHSLTAVYLGLAGLVASGIAGMVVGWRLQPADLAVTPTTPRPSMRRSTRLDPSTSRGRGQAAPHLDVSMIRLDR